MKKPESPEWIAVASTEKEIDSDQVFAFGTSERKALETLRSQIEAGDQRRFAIMEDFIDIYKVKVYSIDKIKEKKAKEATKPKRKNYRNRKDSSKYPI